MPLSINYSIKIISELISPTEIFLHMGHLFFVSFPLGHQITGHSEVLGSGLLLLLLYTSTDLVLCSEIQFYFLETVSYFQEQHLKFPSQEKNRLEIMDNLFLLLRIVPQSFVFSQGFPSHAGERVILRTIHFPETVFLISQCFLFCCQSDVLMVTELKTYGEAPQVLCQ